MVRNPRKEKVNNHKKRTDKKLESLRTREYLTTEDAQIFVILCVCAGYLGTSSLKSSKGVPKTKKNALEKVLSAEWAGRKTSKQKTQSFGHESRFECAMPKNISVCADTLYSFHGIFGVLLRLLAVGFWDGSGFFCPVALFSCLPFPFLFFPETTRNPLKCMHLSVCSLSWSHLLH